MKTGLANLSRAETKKLRFWFYMFMLIFCITCLKTAATKAITGAKHIPAIAVHAVAAVRQIPAMALNAVSFVWAHIYSAIILTGMSFFSQAISLLQTIVVALGAGLGVWGVINLLEGYGNDNPGAKSQGIKQLMAGVGVALVGTQLIPLLAGLFS